MLIRNGVVSANVIEVWYKSYNELGSDRRNSVSLTLSSELVNKFGLPEEHWVSLVLGCFFL